MGNFNSCCAYANGSTPRQPRDSKSGSKNGQFKRSASSGAGLSTGAGLEHFNNGVSNEQKPILKTPRHGQSCGNLQHISEREPDDWETDPSIHPTTGTIFMEKSKQCIQSKFWVVKIHSLSLICNQYLCYTLKKRGIGALLHLPI